MDIVTAVTLAAGAFVVGIVGNRNRPTRDEFERIQFSIALMLNFQMRRMSRATWYAAITCVAYPKKYKQEMSEEARAAAIRDLALRVEDRFLRHQHIKILRRHSL